MKRNYYSVSQITKYQQCGMKYYYHYVEGRPVRPISDYALHGSSIDDAANSHFDGVIENDKGHTISQFVDTAVDFHDTNVDKYELVATKDKSESRDRVSILGKTYHISYAKKFDPMITQYKVHEQHNNHKDFIGYVDLLTVDAKVVDNKVKKSMPMTQETMQNVLSRDLQLVKYADMTDMDTVGMAVVTNTKNPKAEYFEATVTKQDKVITNKLIKRVTDAIEANVFTPTDSQNWWCSAKWCDFWDTCDFGKRRK